MKLAAPLLKGRLVQRYKRFFADVALDDGRVITAHCPNPGAMTGLNTPGLTAFVSVSDNPKRKLGFTLELVKADGVLVGIHAGLANRIVEEALGAKAIPALADYLALRREVRYGQKSRVDFLLADGPDGRPCYVEVKNVHLRRRAGLAEFPDSVTARGARHLHELAAMALAGSRAVILYVVQRADCDRLALATDIDPAYGVAFAEARAQGVEALCYACTVTEAEIRLARPLPLA